MPYLLALALAIAPLTSYADTNGNDVGVQCLKASLTAVDQDVPASQSNIFQIEVWGLGAGDRKAVTNLWRQVDEVKTVLFFYAKELLLRRAGSIDEQSVAIRRVIVASPGACASSEAFCKVFQKQSFELVKVERSKSVLIRADEKVLAANMIAQRLFSQAYLRRSEASFTVARRLSEQGLYIKQQKLEGLARRLTDLSRLAIDEAKKNIAALKAIHVADAVLAATLMQLLQAQFLFDKDAANQLRQVFAEKEPVFLRQLLDLWSIKLGDIDTLKKFQSILTQQFRQLQVAKTPENAAYHMRIMPLVLRDPGAGLFDYIDEDLSSYGRASRLDSVVRKSWKSNMLLGFVTMSDGDDASVSLQIAPNAYVRWSFIEALKETENKNT